MDLVPQVDDSELRKLVDSLKGRGEDCTLRLFACWCARQLKPNNAEWLKLIYSAEKFAQGTVSETRFQSIKNEFGNVAAAAFTIGWKHRSGSAAICLAVASTLAPEASTAAEQAAMWQRRYEMLIALQNGVNSEEVEIADNALANQQVQQLKKMSTNYDNEIGGNMIAKTNRKMPDELAILIGRVLETNSLDPSTISRMWSKGMDLDDEKGVIAIVVLGSDQYYVVVNMPVLVMPINGITINFGEAMQLVMSIAEIPGSSYAMSGDNLYFTYCAQIKPIDETEVPKVIEGLLDVVKGVRHDLLTAFKYFYSSETEIDKPTISEPKLPDIKMTPDEAKVIYGVLLRCDENTRQIYIFLMEKWVRAGYFVETTKASIVLDASYGKARTRIAILLPGISQEIANLNPGVSPMTPVIVLPWDSLNKQSGIPSELIKQYQRDIEKNFPLHTTESSAHIEKVDSMDLQMGRKLLKAMSALAKSIRHDLIEDDKPFKSVTPTNIESTLAVCDEHTQTVFQKIIDEWKKANGTVLCGKVGRIDIKLKTKAHSSGKNARLERNFNLAVLACPKGKQNANIQVTWGLAKDDLSAYLDNIPEAVARYEKILASLPGYEQKGTITRFVIDDSFQDKHVALLIKALLELKEAEANSD